MDIAALLSLRVGTTPGPAPMLDTWGRRNRKLADRICPRCGVQFRPLRNSSKYCSKPCLWVGNGGKNAKPETWWVDSKGYVEGRIWQGETQIRVKQHRHVVEKSIGRKLLPNEDVHHINGLKSDNRIENLMVINHREHTILSNKERSAR